ncbi:MAG TPA: GYD domain-containing protein [Candidatus Dormibacteraeota bacterium]|nr:GYD domain-containing protein [Candidatus Dormibacteraeota bacterium]
MATYVTLARYTHAGIQSVKEGPSRLERARQIGSSMGATIKDFYLTMGRYDMVVVIEAPDDATVARMLLAIGSAGAITTETLRAFPEREYREIIAALP